MIASLFTLSAQKGHFFVLAKLFDSIVSFIFIAVLYALIIEYKPTIAQQITTHKSVSGGE
jgi:hypothetical protein